jgi:hypothetical protein
LAFPGFTPTYWLVISIVFGVIADAEVVVDVLLLVALLPLVLLLLLPPHAASATPAASSATSATANLIGERFGRRDGRRDCDDREPHLGGPGTCGDASDTLSSPSLGVR